MKRLLQNYYHQDAWLDYSKDEEIWVNFLKHEPPETAGALLHEVDQLLDAGSVRIREFVGSYADALYFRNSNQYVTWMKRLKTWLDGEMSSNKSLERTRDR